MIIQTLCRSILTYKFKVFTIFKNCKVEDDIE